MSTPEARTAGRAAARHHRDPRTQENILQVKGRTEPGATVTVNGQRVEVQGDGSFNEYITLDKPGHQVVVIRATSIGGGVKEEQDPSW